MKVISLFTLVLLLSSQSYGRELLTYYCPSIDNAQEGGPRTMFGSKVVTLEESSRTGHLPTLASWLRFNGNCNNHYKSSKNSPRCVAKITVAGARKLPGFRAHVARFKQKYPFLCDTCDTIVGVVEDTGGPYNRQDKNNPRLMFDLAVDSHRLCRNGAGFSTRNIKWSVIGTTPGSGRPKYGSRR